MIEMAKTTLAEASFSPPGWSGGRPSLSKGTLRTPLPPPHFTWWPSAVYPSLVFPGFQWLDSHHSPSSLSSVQSLSHVRLFATPWTAARQASLSVTNSRSLLKLLSIELVIPSNHLIHPLLLPPSIFPSIRVFSFFFFLGIPAF